MMVDEVSFLEELVAIPSPSGEEGAVGDHLAAQMAAMGFQVHRDEVGNVVGALGDRGAGREIVLLGHMDTVPGWIPIRREAGRLYGRGAVDAKGPLAALVLAAAQSARRLRGARLVVVGAVEEEACSRGAHHLVRAMDPPACVIVGEPSGWQGITLGYKGMLRLSYRLTRPVGHSADGRPAVAEEAVAFWNQLAAYAAGRNQGRARCFETLDAALRSIDTFDDGLEEGVRMEVGLRLPPGTDVAGLERQMGEWCNGATLSFPYQELPYRGEKNVPPVWALLRAIRAEGGRPRFKLKLGTSDMNVVGPAWGCPVVAYGPGDSLLDHTPDEHIEIEEFRRGVRVLTRAIEALAG